MPRKAAQPLAPFQFAASRRAQAVVQCIAINIRLCMNVQLDARNHEPNIRCLLTAFQESLCVCANGMLLLFP